MFWAGDPQNWAGNWSRTPAASLGVLFGDIRAADTCLAVSCRRLMNRPACCQASASASQMLARLPFDGIISPPLLGKAGEACEAAMAPFSSIVPIYNCFFSRLLRGKGYAVKMSSRLLPEWIIRWASRAKETLNSGQLCACRGFSRILSYFSVYSQYLFHSLFIKTPHMLRICQRNTWFAHLIQTKLFDAQGGGAEDSVRVCCE